MDDAHRPRIEPRRGEAKMGMDYFFLARATDPQHAKAVLNCLVFQLLAVFSAIVVAVALEAITGRTRLLMSDSRERSQELSGYDQRQQNA